MTTDFVQYKHMDFLEKDLVTTGKMAFVAPDYLQWKYITPYNYSITFKNGKILIDDKGNKKAVDAGNSEMFKKLNKLLIGSVNGNLFDDKEFSIAYSRTDKQTNVIFIPKDAALLKYITRIELVFNKEAIVTQATLTESQDDYSRIVFKNRVINKKIAMAASGG